MRTFFRWFLRRHRAWAGLDANVDGATLDLGANWCTLAAKATLDVILLHRARSPGSDHPLALSPSLLSWLQKPNCHGAGPMSRGS